MHGLPESQRLHISDFTAQHSTLKKKHAESFNFTKDIQCNKNISVSSPVDGAAVNFCLLNMQIIPG